MRGSKLSSCPSLTTFLKCGFCKLNESRALKAERRTRKHPGWEEQHAMLRPLALEMLALHKRTIAAKLSPWAPAQRKRRDIRGG